MDHWNDLVEEVRQTDSILRSREQAERQRLKEGALYEDRLHRATESLFAELVACCKKRAEWLKDETGHLVRVTSESHLMHDEVRLYVVMLSMKDAEIQLYSRRRQYELPAIHLLKALSSRLGSRAAPRLFSLPGAATRMTNQGALHLEYVGPPMEKEGTSATEQLVLRAFELLVHEYVRRRLVVDQPRVIRRASM